MGVKCVTQGCPNQASVHCRWGSESLPFQEADFCDDCMHDLAKRLHGLLARNVAWLSFKPLEELMPTLTPEERYAAVAVETWQRSHPSAHSVHSSLKEYIAAAIRAAVADALSEKQAEAPTAEEPAEPSRVIELPYGAIPRDTVKMACAGGCGGVMEQVPPTLAETEQFSCGRDGCCERAFFCDRCLTRAVGRADAPEANHMRTCV